MHANHTADLVLETLPSGESVWLRPLDQSRAIIVDQVEDDEALYTVTDLGRRAIAMANCFGSWPTVAQVDALHDGRSRA